MAAVRCLFCNRNNPVDAKFCNDCGTTLDSKPCRQCKTRNSRAASACRQCGATFATEAALQTATAGWSDVRSDLAALLGTVPAWDDPPPPSQDRPPGLSKPLPHDARRHAPDMGANMDRVAPASGALLAPAGPTAHHPILMAEPADADKPRRKPMALAIAAAVIGLIGASLFLLRDETDGIRAATRVAADSRIDRVQSLPAQSPQATAMDVAVPLPARAADTGLSVQTAVPELESDADVAVIAVPEASIAPPGVSSTTLRGVSGDAEAVARDRVPQAADRRSPGAGRPAGRQADSGPAYETVRSGGALPSAPAAPNRSYANRDRSSKDQASAAALPAACTDAAAALGFCQTPPAAGPSKASNDAASLESSGKPRAPRGEGSAEAANKNSGSAAGGTHVCTAAVAALGLCDRGSEAPATGASAASTSTTIAGQVRGGQER